MAAPVDDHASGTNSGPGRGHGGDGGESAFDDRLPTAADTTAESRGRRYRAPGITVYFDARKCWHTGVCLRGLPAVFDVTRRPWVDPTADTPQAVAALVDRCPSGALSYDLE